MSDNMLYLIFSWDVFGATLRILVGIFSFAHDNILGEDPLTYHLLSSESSVCVLEIHDFGSIVWFFASCGGKMGLSGLVLIARSSDFLCSYG